MTEKSQIPSDLMRAYEKDLLQRFADSATKTRQLTNDMVLEERQSKICKFELLKI